MNPSQPAKCTSQTTSAGSFRAMRLKKFWVRLNVSGAMAVACFGMCSLLAGALAQGAEVVPAQLTVWRPQSGYFYSRTLAGASTAQQWGASTDIPVGGDFDGDGKKDIAVWRPSTGYWYIIQSSNGQVVTHQWGAPTDVPVVGDFDGDGKADIAVWRPATGYWYISQSSNGQVVTHQWGAPTDLPVMGDFDGDGKADIAVWRPATGDWYIIQSSNGQVVTHQWGAPTDLPVMGDFDGDGKTDIAVWRPATGYWYIVQSSNGEVVAKQFGAVGDIPVPKDYDGDGKTDVAVWRPSNGYWYVIESSTGTTLATQWGASTDVPANGSLEPIAALGSVGSSPGGTNSQVSGDLYGSYLAGIYSVNNANTADSDVLESFTIGGCNTSSTNGATPGTPCPYTSTLTTLASSAASVTNGALSTSSGIGLFQSPNTGALAPFKIPTTLTIAPPANGNGATWSGGISLNDLGGEMVAMQTAAATGQSPLANILIGVAPLQNTSNATLVGPYQLFGMGTNLTTGLGGDEGILQAIDFDGKGGFTAGAESTNTWNPNNQSGGLQRTTNSLSGTYAVKANGTITLTFATGATNGGVLNGMTLTGALNGSVVVLTNTSAVPGLQARVLLVGISQPANNNQLCTSNPLPGPGSANGVYQMVGLSFNTTVFQQLTFNNSGGPTYTVNYDGGTLNSGGSLSSISPAGPFNYTINTSCFIAVSRQSDSSGNILDAAWGTVSRDGSVVAFEDFDTMGGGPVLSFGVRISNVQQLN